VTRNARRRVASAIFSGACGASVLVALVPLLLILFYLLRRGAGALEWSFLFHNPKPVGEAGGGFANAIVGTLVLIALAALFAVPVGILSGVHLSEYRHSRYSAAVRFAADALNGVPSIVVGIFAYSVAVLPVRRFSALAGGFALGVMMIPIIARTTEELLRLVPDSLRDGSLALGATRARAAWTVVLPAALPGILTGILVALARVAGETAPLLFTAFGNRFFSTRLDQPIAALTVQIYTYAVSPYEEWHRQAWAGAFLLVMVVFVLSLVARLATRRLERMHGL
jgi:phosphate transport system permease protein